MSAVICPLTSADMRSDPIREIQLDGDPIFHLSGGSDGFIEESGALTGLSVHSERGDPPLSKDHRE